MTVAWVLGNSGLLGAALCRRLRLEGTEVFIPAERFCWDNDAKLPSQFAAAVHSFSSRVGSTEQWAIYWAAGVGTMSSSESVLAPETRALSSVLRNLESDPNLMNTSGALAFASSAGAIYAGSVSYTHLDVYKRQSPPCAVR